MELKGSNNWSDLDSEESSPSSAKEAPQPAPERSPERKPPLFNVIYSRGPEIEPLVQQPVFQERDRSAPEVDMGVTLGMPELAGVVAPGLPQLEQQRLQQPGIVPEAVHESSEDDDEDDESSDETTDERTTKQSSTKPMPAPTPQSARDVDRQPIIPWQPELEQAAPASVQEAVLPTPNHTGELPNPHDSPEYEPPMYQPEDARTRATAQPQPVEYAPPISGGGNTPPTPPVETRTWQPEPEGWGGGSSDPNLAQTRYAYNTYQSPPNTTEYVTRRVFESAQQEMRRKMAARMIVVALLGWYLGRRPVKPLRQQVNKLEEANKEQTEQLSRLNYARQETEARIAEQNRQIEQFTRPQNVPFSPPERAPAAPNQQVIETVAVAQPIEQQKLIGENGEEITLLPGQRLVREGPYSFVVNEHNQIVHNVIPRGEEFKRDLLRERPPTPFGTKDVRFSSSGGGSGGSGQPMASSSAAPMLPGVQMPSNYPTSTSISSQPYNQNAQYPIDTPKANPVVTAITSPWLWLGVGVLLIAFFAAATI